MYVLPDLKSKLVLPFVKGKKDSASLNAKFANQVTVLVAASD